MIFEFRFNNFELAFCLFRERRDSAVVPLTALLFAEFNYEHMFAKLTVACIGTGEDDKKLVEKVFLLHLFYYLIL